MSVHFVPIAVAFMLCHVDHPQTILLLEKWLLFLTAHLFPLGTWDNTSNTQRQMTTALCAIIMYTTRWHHGPHKHRGTEQGAALALYVNETHFQT